MCVFEAGQVCYGHLEVWQVRRVVHEGAGMQTRLRCALGTVHCSWLYKCSGEAAVFMKLFNVQVC